MKMTSVRSQDQRKMLQANSHTFPTNAWIHKITKKKESDRCDLCKALWLAEGRFKTEKDLPELETKPGSHSAYLRSLISGPHRCSPPMLATDPWRTGPASSSRVEVLLHLGREMPSDDMK